MKIHPRGEKETPRKKSNVSFYSDPRLWIGWVFAISWSMLIVQPLIMLSASLNFSGT